MHLKNAQAKEPPKKAKAKMAKTLNWLQVNRLMVHTYTNFIRDMLNVKRFNRERLENLLKILNSLDGFKEENLPWNCRDELQRNLTTLKNDLKRLPNLARFQNLLARFDLILKLFVSVDPMKQFVQKMDDLNRDLDKFEEALSTL